MTGYGDALAYLFPRTTQIKFGLDTTRALLLAAGNPQELVPTIHVAGTNGKGSVSTLMASAMQQAGLRVGLYTSPHLLSFRERIQVDGVPISEDAVTVWTNALRPAIDDLQATFFEVTTVMALAHFAARHVDIAVMEVGLGGRLDSTNVIEPLVSVITHIALDHQKYLGDTIEEIAAEKAGIAKRGVPLVIGEADSRLATLLRNSAEHFVLEIATQRAEQDGDKGPGRDAGQADAFKPVLVPPDDMWEGPLGLVGAHQRRNAAVAHAALQQLPAAYRPPDSAIRAAFADARVPGRFDRRGKWLFDVAHNPDSMQALVATLQSVRPPGPVHALVSILGDKDWREMLVALDRAIDVGILTIVPSADVRRWDIEWLHRWLADPTRLPARARWHLEPDFAQALAEVQVGAGTIVVTGSFHTVGDVMEALGMEA